MKRVTQITGTHRRRGGFSLVEILSVMAIMMILASLAFVVVGKSGDYARESSTKAAIRILSGALRERVDAFHEMTVSQADPDALQTGSNTRVFQEQRSKFSRWYSRAGNSGFYKSDETFDVFVRKAMYKSLFPQREEDLYGYNGVLDNGGVDDSPVLARMYSGGSLIPKSWKAKEDAARAADPSNLIDDDQAESSELLYLCLTNGDVYGLPPVDVGSVDDRLIGDTDGDGNLEFLDSWGRPLQFYNWPTRLIKDDGVSFTGVVTVGANQYTTTSLLVTNLPRAGVTGPVSATVARNRADRDPEDPTRLLSRTSPQPLIVGAGTFPLLTDAPSSIAISARKFSPDWYHDLNTVTMPLIVSAGQDGILGLHLPTENGTSGTSHTDRLARVIHTDEACQGLSDNITNQQRGPR
ncbi:MAG: type II secretion system protein [Planctomycetaceae bacterium]